MARPRLDKNIDEKKLIALCKSKFPIEWICDFFDVSPETLRRFIKRRHKLSFEKFRAQHLAYTRHNLIQTALVSAMPEVYGKSCLPDMKALSLALKNMCGWSEKQETVIHQEQDITIRIGFADEPEYVASLKDTTPKAINGNAEEIHSGSLGPPIGEDDRRALDSGEETDAGAEERGLLAHTSDT